MFLVSSVCRPWCRPSSLPPFFPPLCVLSVMVWRCDACTYEHENDMLLSCSLCGTVSTRFKQAARQQQHLQQAPKRLNPFSDDAKKQFNKKARGSNSGSSFSLCTICNMNVPRFRLAEHVATCSGSTTSKKSSLQKAWSPSSSEPIPGLRLFPGFLSPEEQGALIGHLSHRQWSTNNLNGVCDILRFGVNPPYNFRLAEVSSIRAVFEQSLSSL